MYRNNNNNNNNNFNEKYWAVAGWKLFGPPAGIRITELRITGLRITGVRITEGPLYHKVADDQFLVDPSHFVIQWP